MLLVTDDSDSNYSAWEASFSLESSPVGSLQLANLLLSSLLYMERRLPFLIMCALDFVIHYGSILGVSDSLWVRK